MRITRIGLLLFALLTQACSTSGALVDARNQFKQGSADAALQTLSNADVSQRDQLLLLLDTALVAQAAGQFDKSITAFQSAYTLTEKLDYISIRDQSAALVSNDWAVRYSGEFSERLWIHTFQMINYLMLGQPEGAAVEARRAVALYSKHGDVLDNDHFTRYLMALSFEAAGQIDSAMVEYRKLAQKVDGIAVPQKAGKQRELVLLIATGFIAPKLPGELVVDINAKVSFPYYPEGYAISPDIDIFVDGARTEPIRVDTQLLSVARYALDKRGKSIAARQALRLAAKYTITESIEEHDMLIGSIARIFLFLIEQADTRSWETLPANLSLVRIKLPHSDSKVRVNIHHSGSNRSASHSETLQLDASNPHGQFRMIRVGVNNARQFVSSP